MKKIHIDLFSGIGGFALAIDRVWGGIEHVFCDNEPFSQAVLQKHWPKSKIYGDIRSLSKEQFLTDTGSEKPHGLYKEPRKKSTQAWEFYILTGGFPCQPFSQAGRRRGTEDDRYLWPEMLRVIRDFKPTWVVAENVSGLITWNEGVVLEQVWSDLENEDYEVQPFIIPAVSKNAPHRRDRIWFIAHTKYEQTRHTKQRGNEEGAPIGAAISDTNDADSKREGHKGDVYKERSGTRYSGRSQFTEWNENWFEVASRLCRVDDGVPKRLDRNSRLKALGNAIVPQIAEEIFKSIRSLTP